MENQTAVLILMGSYALLFGVVWAVFEKRLRIIHRRHVEKCQPFAQVGLERIDTRLRIVIRVLLLTLFVISESIVYLMFR